MKALVAIKRVPDGNAPLRLKADGSGIDAAGMPMRINPFDETALEIAVQWKEASRISEIVAVSIGTETCQETLRHALALGADRAIRIDTIQPEPLAVARILRALVERERPDLILLGKQSSDDDNAQTAPMLAALLDCPQGIAASALAWDGKLVVTREIEGGQETLALSLPAVISADLRLATPRYLKLPHLLAAKKKTIEILAAESFGIDLSRRLERQKVAQPMQLRQQKNINKINDLVECLRQEGLFGEAHLQPSDPANPASCGVALILAEHDGETLHPAVRRAVSAARRLARDIVILTAGGEAVATQAATIAGVSRVLRADSPHFEHPLAEDLAPLLAKTARELGASAVLAAATPFCKAILPRVAALLDCAMLTDVVAIEAPDLFVRPIHAGEALATIRNPEPVKILTVRPSAFAAAAEQPAAAIEPLPCAPTADQSSWLGATRPDSEHPSLATARIVVAGGRGLGSAAQFRALLEPLARHLNAAIGATRAAVDSDFISNDHQVGQTGAIIAPEFYFAIGLSGAAQHLAGMRDSRVIIAINKDPAAPICAHADYVLEGDLFETIPQLLEALQGDS